jgi:hypothetical protein
MVWVRAFIALERATRNTPDHLHQPVAGPGHAALLGLDSAGRGLGVQGIGLSLPMPGSPVGAVDLDHDLALGTEKAGQGGAEAAGAFDPPASTGPNWVAQPSSSP